MELIIMTGMSGAGKSNAANALEDIGYYCIDNIPPLIIPNFVDLLNRGENGINKVAIVTDVRAGGEIGQIVNVVEQVKSIENIDVKILFVDASNECIARRYKETRRRHPVAMINSNISTMQAIQRERELLMPVRQVSDYVIDTTNHKAGEAKSRLIKMFVGDTKNGGMNITCISFGFKYGPVSEADIVFDVRCLKNPFYIPELKNLTGLDDGVRDFVMGLPQTDELANRLKSLIDYVIPLYKDEGKSQVVIAIGCTGGKHRSVVFSELIYHHLLEQGYLAIVNHRDISKI